jgi:hypothetical protein
MMKKSMVTAWLWKNASRSRSSMPCRESQGARLWVDAPLGPRDGSSRPSSCQQEIFGLPVSCHDVAGPQGRCLVWLAANVNTGGRAEIVRNAERTHRLHLAAA